MHPEADAPAFKSRDPWAYPARPCPVRREVVCRVFVMPEGPSELSSASAHCFGGMARFNERMPAKKKTMVEVARKNEAPVALCTMPKTASETSAFGEVMDKKWEKMRNLTGICSVHGEIAEGIGKYLKSNVLTGSLVSGLGSCFVAPAPVAKEIRAAAAPSSDALKNLRNEGKSRRSTTVDPYGSSHRL